MPRRVDPSQDARGIPKGNLGRNGNVPHERTDEAAATVLRLAGYGMAQAEIARVCNSAFGGGFSVDTLDRHYRTELDDGMALAKHDLLKRAHQMAMMQEIPEGVSKDVAFTVASKKMDFLLNVVHRLRPGQSHEFDGGAINITISGDDAEL